MMSVSMCSVNIGTWSTSRISAWTSSSENSSTNWRSIGAPRSAIGWKISRSARAPALVAPTDSSTASAAPVTGMIRSTTWSALSATPPARSTTPAAPSATSAARSATWSTRPTSACAPPATAVTSVRTPSTRPTTVSTRSSMSPTRATRCSASVSRSATRVGRSATTCTASSVQPSTERAAEARSEGVRSRLPMLRGIP